MLEHWRGLTGPPTPRLLYTMEFYAEPVEISSSPDIP